MASLTRRVFLGTAAAAGLVRPAMATLPATLHAAPGTAQLAPEGYDPTPIWGYDAGVPGPVIRVAQGGRVTRQLANDLPQPTSVHWHGIRIDNAMDGVPGMTQAAVEPGGRFDYDFVAPDAGTYWYHPHNRTWEQMARGLYGALIVEEPEAPAVDADHVLLIDDWRLDENAVIHESFGQMHDWAHAGRLGNWVTVNGHPDWQREVGQGARLRLRLVNTANARIFPLVLQGMTAHVIALDGQPVAEPFPVEELTLAPAQRADLIADITAEEGETAWVLERDRDGMLSVAGFPVTGVARTEGLPQPAALAPNPVPALGPLDTAKRAELLMEGGAMGGMQGAMMGGRQMGMREMAAQGKVWAFNGMADMPETPLIQADRGETVVIAMVNDTAWPHAMHLHGHHFRRLGPDGPGPLRDTLLMERGESAEIAFVADNPGKWLLHCHMLEHSAGGMMTWIEVT